MKKKWMGIGGFALISAIFVLVVLAFLGVVMVKVSGVQNATQLMGLQGTQAYLAARSGAEWGISRALSGICGNDTFTIDGFSVTIDCSREPAGAPYQEGSSTFHVYRLHVLAEQGTYPSAGYVSRQVAITLVGPP